MTKDEDEVRRSRANIVVLAAATVAVVRDVPPVRFAAAHRDCEPIKQPEDQ